MGKRQLACAITEKGPIARVTVEKKTVSMCYHAKKTDSMCYHGKKTVSMCYYGKKTDNMCYHGKKTVSMCYHRKKDRQHVLSWKKDRQHVLSWRNTVVVNIFYKIVRRFYVAHISHRKTVVLECLFNKNSGLSSSNYIKKRLQHSCLSVKFAKLLRTPYFTEHLRWLLLIALI